MHRLHSGNHDSLGSLLRIGKYHIRRKGRTTLDQPSQAYFPPDTSAEQVREQTNETNPDRESIIRMFNLIIDETNNFQVIISEHADIREDWYQTLVRENWWNGNNKLVPVEWIEN